MAKRRRNIGQMVGHRIDLMRSREDMALLLKHSQHSGGDVVHAVGIGVDAVRQVGSCHAAVAQIRVGHVVVLTDSRQHFVCLRQFTVGIIAVSVGRQ